MQLWYWKTCALMWRCQALLHWIYLLRVTGFIFFGSVDLFFFGSVDLSSVVISKFVLYNTARCTSGSVDSSIWLLSVSSHLILTRYTSGSVDLFSMIIIGFIFYGYLILTRCISGSMDSNLMVAVDLSFILYNATRCTSGSVD